MAKGGAKATSSAVRGDPQLQAELEDILDSHPIVKSALTSIRSQKLKVTHLSKKERAAFTKISDKLRFGSLAEFKSFLKRTTGCTVDPVHSGKFSDESPSQQEGEEEAAKAADPPATQSAKDVVLHHQKVVAAFSSAIKVHYAGLLADNKISDSDIAALAETFSRVSDPTFSADTLETALGAKNPEQAYAWALSNSTIVYPYLTLASASGHIKTAREETTRAVSWGLRGDKFHLFPKESYNSDSNAWIMLDQIAVRLVGEANVIRDMTFDESIPQLTNEDVSKNSPIATVIIRLLELLRSPGTATLRRGKELTAEDLIKNAVDFVVLEKLYLELEDYKNLELSGEAVSMCRRTEKVERPEGRRTALRNVLVGYKLSEILKGYLTNVPKTTMEHLPFVRFFLDILRMIADRWPHQTGAAIPKAFLMPPSVQLQANIRKGPTIRKKDGNKANLYIPFSYAKSQECTLMPENIKRDIVDIGAKVLKNLDHINKLPVKKANTMLPYYHRYLKCAYSHSDEARKQWRTRCLLPSIEDLKILGDDISEYQNNIVLLDAELTDLEALKVRFEPASDSPDEQSRLVEAVSKEIKRKKEQRARSAR